MSSPTGSPPSPISTWNCSTAWAFPSPSLATARSTPNASTTAACRHWDESLNHGDREARRRRKNVLRPLLPASVVQSLEETSDVLRRRYRQEDVRLHLQ